MDTKSKKFSQFMLVRVVAFILCVGLFVTTLVGCLLMDFSFRSLDYVAGAEDLFQKGTYEESAGLQNEFLEKQSLLLNLLEEYKSEEYIISGKTIKESELESAIQTLFYNGEYAYDGDVIISDTLMAQSSQNQAENGLDEIQRAYENGEISQAEYEELLALYDAGELTEGGTLAETEIVDTSDYSDPAVRAAFIEANKEQIGQIKKNMIKDDLREFEQLKKRLVSLDGFTYYATDGTYTITNLDIASGAAVKAAQFTEHPAYLVYEDDTMEKMPLSNGIGGWMATLDMELEAELDGYYNDDLKVFFAFDDSFLAAKQMDYAAAKGEMTKWFPVVGGAALLTLILFIWLIVTTGSRDSLGNRKLYKLDRVWTEVLLAVMGMALFLGIGISIDNIYGYYGGYYYDGGYYSVASNVNNIPIVEIAMIALLAGISAALGLWCFLACVRLLKARKLIQNSLIYRIIAAVGRAIQTVYHGGSVMQKIVILALGVCLLSATMFLAPVVFLAILVFAPKWVKKYLEVKKGVDEVKSGNLSYKIPLTGSSELDDLAKGINEISEASNIAVQNELKNQRMKTELISNVSHDLKTPLTSMVTYIDLLKTEGLDSPNAGEYLNVLDQKTNRLRQLTEDLFEAAKASSGAIPVRMERVEMMSLINQGMGEFDQRIRESGLDFIVNAPSEKYYVWADGQLLWRVVENLLGNVLKYAQEGTRVYINLTEQRSEQGSGMVVLDIKNVSKQALNIDADELLERFKRGDESRTTEGSGLGLAIAKDLVKLQNGWFEIKIDGDLFKAIVMLTRHEGPSNVEETSEENTHA